MSNRTVKVIIFLVALLFLNIEAAQAGLVHRVKMYIQHEFSDFQLIYLTGAVLAFAFLSYIIATPVMIGKERRIWFTDIDDPSVTEFSSRKVAVRRISGLLSTPAAVTKSR